jgi:hypothetical protein
MPQKGKTIGDRNAQNSQKGKTIGNSNGQILQNGKTNGNRNAKKGIGFGKNGYLM